MAAIGILSSPLEAMVPDAHDGDASAMQFEEDGTRHEHGSAPDAPAHDDHAVHICHCVHSHFGLPGHNAMAAGDGNRRSDAPAFHPAAPGTPAPAEFFRPPIA